MSLLLKAFPHGRPYPSARSARAPRRRRGDLRRAASPRCCRWPALPRGAPSSAPAAAGGRRSPARREPRPEHRKQQRKKRSRSSTRSSTHKPKPKPRPGRSLGQPPRSFVVPADELLQLSQPGRAQGAPGDPQPGAEDDQQHLGRTPRPASAPRCPENGTIRIATWSFDDWDVAQALVAARKRGVSVQVVAAKAREQGPPGLALAAQAPRPEARTARATRHARDGQLRRVVPGRVPRSRRHGAREVLPVRQRRRRAQAARVSFQTSSNLTYMA